MAIGVKEREKSVRAENARVLLESAESVRVKCLLLTSLKQHQADLDRCWPACAWDRGIPRLLVRRALDPKGDDDNGIDAKDQDSCHPK